MHFRRFAIALAAATCLAACQQQEDASASANPDAKPGLTASAGTLVLPAVSGNPGAAYFAISNEGDKAAQIAALFVEGAARAEMHETKGGSMSPLAQVPVAPGTTVRFEAGGKHAMLFDLDPALAAGGTTELTVVFADGDKLSTPLAIEAAGGPAATSPQN